MLKEILQQRDVPALTEVNIEQVLEQFRGDIKQSATDVFGTETKVALCMS